MLCETLALSKHMHLLLVMLVAVYFAPYVGGDSLCFQGVAPTTEREDACLSRASTYLLCTF